MKTKIITFYDMYSGASGFRKALEDLNEDGHPLKFQCVWSNDNDKFVNRVQQYHYGKKGHSSADIRTVDPEDLPNVEIICAGFPCPAFSPSGLRKGFDDPRGALFFEILRIAKVKKPKMLFLENVNGIRWHDEGRTLTRVLLRIRALGYNVGYQVFNSRFHGVAQDRSRCFIIGVLGKEGPRQILPLIENDRISTSKQEDRKMEQVAQSLLARDYANWQGNFVITPERAATLTTGGKGGGLHSNMTLIFDAYNKALRKDELTGALKTNPRSGPMVVALVSTNPHNKEEKREYRLSDVIKTLATPFRSQRNVILDLLLGRMRMLTPRESERLQGFPDDWTLWGIHEEKDIKIKMSDYQRYKMMGNAVTVYVVMVIGYFIRKTFEEFYNDA